MVSAECHCARSKSSAFDSLNFVTACARHASGTLLRYCRKARGAGELLLDVCGRAIEILRQLQRQLFSHASPVRGARISASRAAHSASRYMAWPAFRNPAYPESVFPLLGKPTAIIPAAAAA